MLLKATCGECFREYKVKATFAGKRFRCKSCGANVQIPPTAQARETAANEDLDWEDYDDSAAPSVLPPVIAPARNNRSPASAGKRKRSKTSRKKCRRAGLPVGVLATIAGVLVLSVVLGALSIVFMREDAPVTAIALDGDYVSFPRAGVKLIRPTGFEDGSNFDGFQQASTQASVVVAKLPGAFSEIEEAFTADQMKTRGMILQSKQHLEIDGSTGMLLSVTQNVAGTEVGKWLVAFGNDHETIIVTANFPQIHEAKLSDELKAVVLSTKRDDTPAGARGSGVGFSISASRKMKSTPAMGKMLVYTKDGVVPAKSPEDPLFIATPSVSTSRIEDKRQFAIQRLYQTAHTKIGSVTTNDTITIDGLDGFELLASAQDAESRVPLTVYQVVLFDNGTYFLMQGLVGARLGDEFVPEFKAMARSFARHR